MQVADRLLSSSNAYLYTAWDKLSIPIHNTLARWYEAIPWTWDRYWTSTWSKPIEYYLQSSILAPICHCAGSHELCIFDCLHRREAMRKGSVLDAFNLTPTQLVHVEITHIQVLLSSALAELSLPLVPYRATREGSNHLLTEEIAEPAVSYVVYLISVGES